MPLRGTSKINSFNKAETNFPVKFLGSDYAPSFEQAYCVGDSWQRRIVVRAGQTHFPRIDHDATSHQCDEQRLQDGNTGLPHTTQRAIN